MLVQARAGHDRLGGENLHIPLALNVEKRVLESEKLVGVLGRHFDEFVVRSIFLESLML